MRTADGRPPARLLTFGAVAGTYVCCPNDLVLGSLAGMFIGAETRLTNDAGRVREQLNVG